MPQLRLLFGVLVFAITFQLHYNYLINTYYHFGMAYNDGGILSQIIWRSDWKLTPPLFFTNYSFHGVHFTPLFSLLNVFSYVIHSHMAEYYSAFLASVYAGLGTILFGLCTHCMKPNNFWQLAALALLSVLFAFNAIVMNGIWIGHFEYAIPLAILCFMFCYVQGHKRLGVLAFILLLSIREDAGLHLIAILGLIGVIKSIQQRSVLAAKREIKYGAIAFAYCAFAMWMSLAARSYYSSTFQDIYSGNPPFAHITAHMLWQRATIMSTEHFYLWSSFLITAFVAYRARNPYMLVGFLAYIPWFILNWIALNPNTGHLYAYYAFPFITSLAWPLISVMLHHGNPLPRYAVKQAFKLQVAMVLLALVMWNETDKKPEFGPTFGARWGSYSIQHGADGRIESRNFIKNLQAGAGNLGKVIADSGILSLAKGGEYQGAHMLRIETDKPADTIIYMEPYQGLPASQVIEQAARNKLNAHYCMPATTICMFTKRSAGQLGLFLAMMVEKPLPDSLKTILKTP